jgi:hypothetical protein
MCLISVKFHSGQVSFPVPRTKTDGAHHKNAKIGVMTDFHQISPGRFATKSWT